ncbi:MAG: tryptophan-rich sensory protein [Patescibacteria group bacterium]|nr:tryptophan-rich sensory protein [Patescibacteria group bacterium]
MRSKKIVQLIVSVVVCQGVGVLGSLFTMPAIPGWYASLVKPSFSPPNWVFAPAWTTLFLLMGIALYLVWQKGGGRERERALSIFFGQLMLNVLWSSLFFGLHSPQIAFLEILILWLSILATVIVFYRISRVAGLLLLPYILWVSFAAILNFSIWRLNI